MNAALSRNLYFVKEHVGLFKAANEFDIHDPENQQVLFEVREPKLGWVTKILRFTDYKRMTPFDVVIRQPNGPQVIRVTRGVSIFLSKVKVLDENDHLVGGFKQKFLSIGGAFSLLDAQDHPLGELQGSWTSWDFKFTRDGQELAQVSKKWAGIGKELFTSADNYMLKISESVPQNDPIRMLIVAAVICIDMVLKE